MIVTNLVNRVQPLIRYEMNDIVELGEPCPCGSHFRVISRSSAGMMMSWSCADARWVEAALFPDLVSRWIYHHRR
jgi:phenylacetate-coenzyme A ligase PaaK-like adenylate-forming protein